MRIRALGPGVDDWGDVGSPVPETTEEGAANARYLAPILRVCEQIAAIVEDAVGQEHIPLVLGGDHSIAIGTLGGMAKARGPGAALWIDAHGDLNRPAPRRPATCTACRSPRRSGRRGRLRQRRLSAPSVTRAALVGVRSLDQGERDLIRELDLRVFTMSEIDSLGVERVHARGARVPRGRTVPARQPRPRRGRSDVRAGRRHAGPRRALLPRGAPRARARRRVRAARLARRRRGQPDPRPRERDGELAVELVASALGARIL